MSIDEIKQRPREIFGGHCQDYRQEVKDGTTEQLLDELASCEKMMCFWGRTLSVRGQMHDEEGGSFGHWEEYGPPNWKEFRRRDWDTPSLCRAIRDELSDRLSREVIPRSGRLRFLEDTLRYFGGEVSQSLF
jgi:hypothetical protein